ncbi:formate dehydrogenase subunit gamma [Pseudonocardia kongjuensis]|uniref:Formate dehydrogenase subunit gamma n=2 Tax=Pseudonocardia kongjuensis TaxID=102227 RepID=A0ABN1Y210_9PSEU
MGRHMSDVALDTGRAAAVREIAAGLSGERGALMPILHRVVEEIGHITHADTAVIAEVLNLSEAEVHGVATFYKDFRRTPAAECVVQICRAEACQAVGANELVEHATGTLGIAMDARTDDGTYELEQIFCLGNCALGPAVTVDGRLHGRVTPDRFDALLQERAR